QVRVRRAPWLGLARADAHAALLLRLVAVAQRCLDRLGQAVPHVLGRLNARGQGELVRLGRVLAAPGRISPLAAAEARAVGGREPAAEADARGERQGPGLAGPELRRAAGAEAVVAHAPGVAAGERDVRDDAAHERGQGGAAPGDPDLRPGAFLGRLIAGARADRVHLVVAVGDVQAGQAVEPDTPAVADLVAVDGGAGRVVADEAEVVESTEAGLVAEVRIDRRPLKARAQGAVPREIEGLDGAAEGIQGANKEPAGRGRAKQRLHERPRVDLQRAGDLAVRVE